MPETETAQRPFFVTLWSAVATGVVFTVFALVSTQIHAVRAGSPWQDDPYNGMVSFTMFLVPALVVTTALRAWLSRGGRGWPEFRVDQLLRAALVTFALVGATVLVDALAVVLRVDRSKWDGHTPWLIASLVPLGAAAVAGIAMQRRTARRIKPAGDGDWLDDLSALLGGRFDPAFLRRRIVSAAALLSVALSLAITTREAIAVDWTSPLLYVTFAALAFGGFFAFCLIAEAALQIARPGPKLRFRAALIAGLIALPVSAVCRDSIWSVLTGHPSVDTIPVLAGIVFVSGPVVALAVLTGTMVAHRMHIAGTSR